MLELDKRLDTGAFRKKKNDFVDGAMPTEDFIQGVDGDGVLDLEDGD